MIAPLEQRLGEDLIDRDDAVNYFEVLEECMRDPDGTHLAFVTLGQIAMLSQCAVSYPSDPAAEVPAVLLQDDDDDSRLISELRMVLRSMVEARERETQQARTSDFFRRGSRPTPSMCARSTVQILGYLPFSQSGGALLFHLLSKLYERTSVVITTNLSFAEWATVLGDAKMTTALLNRLTHHCHIVERGNGSWRLRNSSAQAASLKATKPTKGKKETGSPLDLSTTD